MSDQRDSRAAFYASNQLEIPGLERIQSISRDTAANYEVEVRMKRAISSERDATFIRGPGDAFNVLRHTAEADRESFYCLHLNARGQLISLEEVARGTLSSCVVHPREVYKSAILQSASAVVVSHNHPSGDPRPSDDDLTLTQRLKSVGEIVGIGLVDHVIIGGGGYYSSREIGNSQIAT